MKSGWFYAAAILGGLYMMRTAANTSTQEALTRPNVKAFLALIRKLESAGQYDVIYGGSKFSDFSAHPNIRIPFHNPRRSGEGVNDYSTAAGAYQINYPTWLTIQAVAFLPDFTPASQDIAAVWLLQSRGVLNDIINGNFTVALRKASPTWASLPFSDAGQNPAAFQTALNIYVNYGGHIA